MKIEVLFPDLSNLYGDMSNIKYLQASAPDIEVVYTDNTATPLFVTERVDMIYLGSMPESKQELAITRLMPYSARLRELIEDDVVLLATGNALEIFGEYITDEDKKIDALGFFPFHAERDMQNRHNSMFLGKFEGIKIVGNKAQFSFCYGRFEHPFVEVTGGYGINLDEKFEGVHYRNLFATYLLGPFLVLNPYFTKYLLRLLGHDDALAFEKEAVDAYNFRLQKLEMPDARFLMGEHG